MWYKNDVEKKEREKSSRRAISQEGSNRTPCKNPSCISKRKNRNETDDVSLLEKRFRPNTYVNALY